MNEGVNNRNEILFAAAVCCISVYVIFTVINFPKEAKTFPFLVSCFTLGLSIIEGTMAYMRMKRRSKESTQDQASAKRAPSTTLIVTAFALIIYPLSVWLIGFYFATAIFLPVAMRLLGVERPLHILAATVFLLGLMLVIFTVILHLQLPLGVLWGGN